METSPSPESLPPDSQVASPEVSIQPSAPASVSSDPQPPDPPPSTRSIPGDLAAIARFPRNKISKLAPDIRESINRLLRERVPYHEIIQRLGPHGQHLNKNNLYRWKKTGYLLWLQEQEKREDARAQLDLLLDLVRENDNGTIHEAAQQLAALKICYALAGLDLAAMRQSFQRDPAALLRLVQALPKLSEGGMTCEKLRLDAVERKIKLEQEKIPHSERGISDEALARAEHDLKLL